MKSSTWIASALGSLAVLVLLGAAPPPDKAGPADVTLVKMTGDSITVLFTPPSGTEGIIEAELYELGGNMLGRVSEIHSGTPETLEIQASVKPDDSASYYLRYRFKPEEPFRQRSLFYMTQLLETIVQAEREYLAGTRPMVRILARDRAAGVPVREARVTVQLTADGKELVNVKTKTNPDGEVNVRLDLPDRPIEKAELKIEVATATAQDVVTETIRVRSGLRTMLTTDKPMYQPGQIIHMRALSLSQPSMMPLKKADALFEVEDSKGNKVFKKSVGTDEYGISHADFVLADELNQGAYRIRHLAAGAKEEKTVTVERYVLPKFKVNFKSDRNFYQPGETVKCDLQVDYFFGKPVAGGQVTVKCSKFDVAYVDFQTVEGKTDAQGHYSFEVKLPAQFVGQPLEAGKASAKFEITVIDTADHREKLARNVAVTENPIIVAAVPESGELIPGLENKVYIVTTYADSAPAQCRVTASDGAGSPVTVSTDAGGFGEMRLTPQEGKPVSLTLVAVDEKGQGGKATAALGIREKKGDDRVLLRTGRTLCKVGDEVAFSVFSTRKSGAVYVDVIKDQQTWLTKTLELQDGKAADKIALDAGLSGTVQLSAYLIGANGVIVRDRRLIVVDPANDLRIAVEPGAESYLPGKDAKIAVRVEDKRGRGTASALGVIVVDEAVFALQEMQPGLEKVYFYLEREIATPRYEIHGHEIGEVVPLPGTPRADIERRNEAAKVLLASAKGAPEHTISVDTWTQKNKEAGFQDKMQQFLTKCYAKIQKALSDYAGAQKKENKAQTDVGVTIDELVKEGYLARKDSLDPWGNALQIEGSWCKSCRTYHGFTLKSAGIDGKWNTADDVTSGGMQRLRMMKGMAFARGGAVNGEMRMAEDGMELAAMAMPMAAMAPAGESTVSATKTKQDESGGSAGAAAPPRIREYFPETLYFAPAIITDWRGRAELNIPLADSITTWRMTCMASSSDGALGSATAGIRVFQDFFVDVDFPVSLTRNDEVSVPVAVYNYLAVTQQVRLVAEKADWFELQGAAEQTVTLGPSEVKAVYFPIVAKGMGFQKFTVFGYGAKKSDAVSRSVEIVPDGKEHLLSFSGRMEGNVAQKVAIPADAIEGASKVFVKIYPGMLSQVIEGLESLLRMPGGCFEQTSSATYPNVLALGYMKTTGKITPEVRMKAEGFINNGYQRLLSFEVAGGGFEWFGKAPAHRILTAYGLMEFYDMSKVSEVDPAVISRTQRWLANGQEPDGSYKPVQGGIREGAINQYTDDVLRNTAYIAWALAYTGYTGPEVDKAIGYIKGRTSDLKDNFTLALAANALATVSPKNETTLKVLQMLFDRRTEEKDTVYWKVTSETPTHGEGQAGDIEVTGLAVQAFIKAGRELATMSKAVTYLARSKDAFGTWQSTQATIQALRAMLQAESGATQEANATIHLAMNGKDVKTLSVDKSNSDVLQLVDLKELTKPGENTVDLKFAGEGSLLYQIVGRYYVPYREVMPEHGPEPLTIALDYDRTQLAADDTLNVSAKVTWNLPGKAKMIIVDLGLPPGFTLIPDALNRLVESGAIEKYSVTGRQIIVYLRELEQGKPATIKYQLLAKYPLKAKTAKSAVYQYYDPSSRAEADPVELRVKGK